MTVNRVLMNETALTKEAFYERWPGGIVPGNRWDMFHESPSWDMIIILRSHGGTVPATWSVTGQIVEMHDGWLGPIQTTAKLLPIPDAQISSTILEGVGPCHPNFMIPIANPAYQPDPAAASYDPRATIPNPKAPVGGAAGIIGDETVPAFNATNPIISRRSVKLRTLRDKFVLGFNWADGSSHTMSIYVAAVATVPF